jgi:hypothetical protein
MGMPTLIGAGVGAVGSAITGQSPLKGALLGGATGGLFGGSDSLLGGKIANMFSSGVTPGVALTTDAAGTAIAPGMGINNLFSQVPTTGIGTNLGPIGGGALPATTTTGAFADGINLTAANLAGGASGIPLGAMDTSKIFNYTPPTAMDKITGAGTMLSDWAQANPSQALGTGLQGYQALNQPAPQLNLPVAPTAPITQRPAPSFGLGQDEKLLTRLSPSYGGLQVYGRGY